MAKYEGLVSLLNAEWDGADVVELTFGQVAASVKGGELPASAYRSSAWWANDSVGHVQSRAWLAGGWRVVWADLQEQKTVFARSTPAALLVDVEGIRAHLDWLFELITTDGPNSSFVPADWWTYLAGDIWDPVDPHGSEVRIRARMALLGRESELLNWTDGLLGRALLAQGKNDEVLRTVPMEIGMTLWAAQVFWIAQARVETLRGDSESAAYWYGAAIKVPGAGYADAGYILLAMYELATSGPFESSSSEMLARLALEYEQRFTAAGLAAPYSQWQRHRLGNREGAGSV